MCFLLHKQEQKSLGHRKILEHSQIQKKNQGKTTESQHFSMLKFLDGHSLYTYIDDCWIFGLYATMNSNGISLIFVDDIDMILLAPQQSSDILDMD